MNSPSFCFKQSQTLALTCFIALIASFSNAESSQGKASPAYASSLIFGMSTALSGPAQYLGHSMRDGVLTAFKRVNSMENGIQGRPIELLVKDDSYQPDSALKNVQLLINKYQVLALIGNVGTPTAAKTAPYANTQKVVFFAAYTGAAILRQDPPQAYVINLRPGYDKEAQEIIRYILNQGIKPAEIAFLLQGENHTEADDYGKAGYSAVRKALEAHGFNGSRKLLQTYYPRNTLEISPALKELLKQRSPPRAIVIVGAYAPSAKFINYAQSLFTDTLFFNLSFTGASALAKELPPHSDRVFITQVVPQINPALEISQDFIQDMKKFSPNKQINAISFEGYIAGRSLVDALNSIDGAINRESIRIALSKSNQDKNRVWLAKNNPPLGFLPIHSN